MRETIIGRSYYHLGSLRANVRLSEIEFILLALPPPEFTRGRSHQPYRAFKGDSIPPSNIEHGAASCKAATGTTFRLHLPHRLLIYARGDGVRPPSKLGKLR
jgi:hypothetical protein